MEDADVQDALIYSSIQNILTSTNFTNFSNITDESKPDTLNTLISNSTIKRACCLANETTSGSGLFKIDVKLPYVEEIVKQKAAMVPAKISQKQAELYKKLGFMTKTITVPKSICDKYQVNAPSKTDSSKRYCDKFYRTYCENTKQMYITDLSGAYLESEYVSAHPDCACYIDKPNGFPPEIQATCYATGCSPEVSSVFIDNNSRSNPCTQNICNNIPNYTRFDVSGHICKSINDLPTGTGTPTGTPTPTGTGTPTDSPTSSNTTSTIYIIIGIVLIIIIIIVVIVIIMSKKKKEKSLKIMNED